MDVSSILEILPAPHAVFSRLATHRDRPRFQVRDATGAWQPVTWGQFATQIRGVADGFFVPLYFVALGATQIVPGKEICQAGTLRGRHVFEVATAIDDLPEILALDALQGAANREQPVRGFRLHIA